jgi:hypothetical protein
MEVDVRDAVAEGIQHIRRLSLLDERGHGEEAGAGYEGEQHEPLPSGQHHHEDEGQRADERR